MVAKVLLFLLVPMSYLNAFDLNPNYTPERVDVYIDRADIKASGLRLGKVVSALRMSARQWNKYSKVKIRIVKKPEDANCTIKSYIDDANYLGMFSPVEIESGILRRSEILINSARQQNLLSGVILHELGHVLGIRHSNIPSATMFPYITTDTLRLDQDDIDAVKEKFQ